LRGRNYYKRKYRSNKEVLRIYLCDFAKTVLKQENFYPRNEELPIVPKGSEQKLIEFLYNNANICITPEILLENSTPYKLVKYCAFTKSVLKLNYERDQVQRIFKGNKKLYKSSLEEYELLFNYIGYIPSDYYRFKYPFPLENSEKNEEKIINK